MEGRTCAVVDYSWKVAEVTGEYLDHQQLNHNHLNLLRNTAKIVRMPKGQILLPKKL